MNPEDEVQQTSLQRGRYRLIQRLGVGGFSSVEQAEDLHTGRMVAIKCISLHGLTAQEMIDATDTFNREVSVLSDLSFPHLPHIYDSFSDAEHWYLVMDWINGETLEEYARRVSATSSRPGLPLEEVLDIGLQLCAVLDYLHTRQPPIIFRDLKPDNIMRMQTGDLYLIDFGIARRFVPGKRKDTIPLGSPGYAAPEQYGTAQTTPQSDLYSLGVLLYALLTGNDPLEKPVDFPLLTASTDGERRDLDALILRLVEHDAEKRPESAAIVKEELERIVCTHLPVTSHVRQRVEELHPFASREQAPSTTRAQHVQANPHQPELTRRSVLAGLGIASVLATAGALWASHLRPLPGIPLSLFKPTPPENRPVLTPPEGPETMPAPETTSTPEIPYDKRTRFTYHGQSDGGSLKVIWLFDSKRYAFLQLVDDVGTVAVVNVATEKIIHQDTQWSLTDTFNDIARSPDGNLIAIGCMQSLQIWKISRDHQVVATGESPGAIFTLAWSPDGKSIAAGTINIATQTSMVCLWDAGTYQVVRTYTGHQDHVYSVSWSPDSQRVVSCDRSGVVKVWESRSGKDLVTYQGHQPATSVNVVRWSPDGRAIASGGDDATVQVWDAATGKTLYVYRKHTDVIADLCWAPGGKQIVSSGAHSDSSVQIWEAMTGKPFAPPYRGHSGVVISVAWSPDGRYIGSACDNDHTIQIWTPQ